MSAYTDILIGERDRLGILSVRPGITGFSQIMGIDMRTPRIPCRADLWMIDNLSLKLYIFILIKTVLLPLLRQKN